jgi:uncharacterized membrane protein
MENEYKLLLGVQHFVRLQGWRFIPVAALSAIYTTGYITIACNLPVMISSGLKMVVLGRYRCINLTFNFK